jgi:GTP cyclohydrolase III
MTGMAGVLSNVGIGQVQTTVQAVQLPNQELEAIRNSANITGTGAIQKSPFG